MKAKQKTRAKAKAGKAKRAKMVKKDKAVKRAAASLRRQYTTARISGKKRANGVLAAAGGVAAKVVKPRNKVVKIGPNTSAIVPIDADEDEVRAKYGVGRGEHAATPRVPPRREPLPAPKRMLIDVDLIDDSAAGGRSAMTAEEQRGIADLADSFRGSKMLQPIGVVELNGKATKDKTYGLVWGWRRTQAMKLLAAGAAGSVAAKIEAEVFPASCADRVEELRAIENVQRADWDLIEEAMAVARMLEQTPADEAGATSLSARCRAVGSRLGKSESWVLDRSYLARLSGRARDLVKCGRLPLQQAREISTLADPALRDRMAEMAARAEDLSGGMDFGRVARWCREHRHSLRTVPWRLDVEFAGGPACVECPSNTANDLTLFAHDKDAHQEVAELGARGGGVGMCMNEKCFEKKRRAAEQTIQAGVSRVQKALKTNKSLEVNATGLASESLIPATIKPSSFVRKAQSDVLPAKKSTGRDDGKDLPGGGPKADTESPAARAKRNAREDLDAADRAWRAAAEKAVLLALGKVPGAMAVLAFYASASNRFKMLEQAWGGSDSEARCAKLCQSPDLRAMLEAVVSGNLGAVRDLETELAGLLAESKRGSKTIDGDYLADHVDQWGTAVVETLGEMLGATLDPRPKLETFLEARGVPAGAKK